MDISSTRIPINRSQCRVTLPRVALRPRPGPLSGRRRLCCFVALLLLHYCCWTFDLSTVECLLLGHLLAVLFNPERPYTADSDPLVYGRSMGAESDLADHRNRLGRVLFVRWSVTQLVAGMLWPLRPDAEIARCSAVDSKLANGGLQGILPADLSTSTRRP